MKASCRGLQSFKASRLIRHQTSLFELNRVCFTSQGYKGFNAVVCLYSRPGGKGQCGASAAEQ